MAVPVPEAYMALRLTAPVASSSCGVPATSTFSLNATVMLIIAPVPYVPSASGEVTLMTVGRVVSAGGPVIPPLLPLVSTTMVPELDSEPSVPGSTKSKTAALPALSMMDPPLSFSAPVSV